MREQLSNHIALHGLFAPADRILLAVSGGMDSMVLLHLLHTSGYAVGVAHCNFQLRGGESDGDEALVHETCSAYGVPCYVKRFDTQSYASEQGLSIQMAARALRYDFFDLLREQHGYRWLATAHHANDSLETVLLNLVRGTGLDGLTGIPVRNGAIVRPLLFATRAAIAAYAQEHGIAWREDSSNSSDYYHRNLIRNQVLPLLRMINPNLDAGFPDSAERIAGARALAAGALDDLRDRLFTFQSDRIHINRTQLVNQPWPAVILWELLKQKGFTYEQCKVICQEHQTGCRFYTSTHELVTDREIYVVLPRTKDIPVSVHIDKETTTVRMPHVSLVLESLAVADFRLRRDAGIAQLDLDRLQFPLLWRVWQPGDSFIPLGMKHPKKISDFLIDLKMSLPDKEQVTVLVSGDEIVWVTGLRISDRFKVTADTRRVLVIRCASVVL